MNEERFPVLWLYGPPGVGKSEVSWQLFTELAQTGARVAFTETDQLGMCFPAPAGASGRQRIKVRNLRAMIPNYREAGAQCMIVNGVLDPVDGLGSEPLPARVMTCRLRADVEEVVRRFVAREGPHGDLREVRDEVASMDKSDFADACIDTTGVTAGDVAAMVRKECATWPGFAGARPETDVPGVSIGGGSAGGQVMLICGPAGAGKSTIGFELYLRCLRTGITTGYVDLDQIGFLRPAADRAARHRLKARNLAAVWRNYRAAAGATHLIATGPIEDNEALQIYRQELPAATITVRRLRAGSQELRRRILSRGAGGSWPQPGDPLRGQPPEVLLEAAARAAEEAATLDGAGLDGAAIETDGRTPGESARLTGRAPGWPSY